MTKNRRHDIVKPSKYKTSMCTFFRSEEGCPFGDKCAFAHGEDELRPQPKDAAPEADAMTADAVASAGAALPAPDSPLSEHVDARAAAGNEQPNDAPVQKLPLDPSAITSATAAAKRKAKKSGFDLSSVLPGNTLGSPGSGSAVRGDASTTRGRALPHRRQQVPPPPPSLPGHGVMPPSALGLAVPPPLLLPTTTPSFGLSSDFGSLAHSGMSAVMPGMPYYIPAMGHHPFSVINNNQHTINVAPAIQGTASYTTLRHSMQLPPPPPPPPPTASGSSALPPVTGPANGVTVSDALPSEDTERRQRQPLRHVSSNTIAHGTGRHPTNALATAPDGMATPPYVYGLLKEADALLSSSQAAASSSQQNSGVEQPTQPRLIVVPHFSESGSYVIPGTVMNYPHADPQGAAAVGGVAAASSPRHSTRSIPGSSDSGALSRQPSTTMTNNSGAATQLPQRDFVASAPAPATVTHPPLNSGSNGRSGGGSSTAIGDSLWAPTKGGMHPLTSSLASHTTATTPSTEGCNSSAGDYNAILSDLGIGGASYTTIPLDRFMCQRGASSNEEDASLGGDLDWSAAVERWLQPACEDVTVAAPGGRPSVGSTAAPKAGAPIISPPEAASAAAKSSTAPMVIFHPEGGRSVVTALNSHPVLMSTEVKSMEVSTSSPTPTRLATEAKRKPAATVCQVSRATGGSLSQSQRRAPIMKNHFKSSCAAEADSGAVLLYCAEKNTFVYIASGGSGATVDVAPARHRDQATVPLTTASAAPSQSGAKPSIATMAAVPAVAPSQENVKSAAATDSLGIHVRFVPGRKVRAVLEEVSDEEAEYCI
ncbi:hypothetical protein LSCM1_06825 [Leishmania martiniquensis]|uniref:C3H1-type domain-containing protein n=1 Tax=Leishmania martiniquensis TaxID=1580590 RepID=A0A836KU18_9TRYP|nr:hypothetical protein LSCM1_06825 [Leishmania martiniquensis]